MFLSPEDDFNRIPYAIANVPENAETLQTVIDRVEKDFLITVLGLETYNDFVLGIEALPEVWDAGEDYELNDEVYQGVTVWRALQPNTGVVPVEGADWTKVRDDFWLKLRDGFGYEYCSRAYAYEGVKTFLIPLVYYTWLKDFVHSTQTDGGIVASETENAQQQGSRDKMVAAWNDAANKVGCNNRPKIASLWGFLYANQDEPELDELSFGSITKLNVFDF